MHTLVLQPNHVNTNYSQRTLLVYLQLVQWSVIMCERGEGTAREVIVMRRTEDEHTLTMYWVWLVGVVKW